MEAKNSVFIATSLDGYIADENGGVDWLHSIPNPEQDDMGYVAFTRDIDALVMGRVTFETVCGFDVDWPYDKPVFVLSNSLAGIPEAYRGKAFLTRGTPEEVLSELHGKGFYRLYIDGGTTIRHFLEADLIDEMVISTLPILLGGGIPLFSSLPRPLQFELAGTTTYLGQIAQRRYIRKR